MYSPRGYFARELMPETRFALKQYSRYGALIVWPRIYSHLPLLTAQPE